MLARAITREVRLYQTTTPVPFEVIVSGCAGNMRPIFSAIADDSAFDPTAAAELGIQRAGDGVPLTSLMEAYRVGFRCVWDAVMTESATHNHVNGEALRVLTAKVSAAQDIYTDAMAVAYREEQARRVLSDESERSVLIDSVLRGRLFEQWSVWEAADYLRLPTEGPYVVIAAEIAEIGIGSPAGSRIEAAEHGRVLRVADASRSAGRDRARQDRQTPRERVGARVPHSDDAGRGERALQRPARDGTSASIRQDHPARQARRRSAGDTVRRLDTRHRRGQRARGDGQTRDAQRSSASPNSLISERDILFDTFRVWVENDGSLRVAGELLFCHPNTVRYRLHRIEQRTGRSLSRPRDVAELCLAMEVHRRLMWQTQDHDQQTPVP